VQVLFVSGLSLIVSMGNLFFRDVKYIMTFVLQMWFFATNVAYPLRFSQHVWMRWLASANPMIAILNAYRDCLMGQAFHPGTALNLGVAAVIAVAVAAVIRVDVPVAETAGGATSHPNRRSSLAIFQFCRPRSRTAREERWVLSNLIWRNDS